MILRILRRLKQLARRHLKPYIIFDVGSRNGRTFLHRCKQDWGTIVYAFEPEPGSYQAVLDNTRGVSNFHAFPICVTTKDGEVEFNVSSVTGNHSLYEFVPKVNEVWKNPFKGQMQDIPDFRVEGKVKVKATRLDTFIDQQKIPYISYLHIDAQGEDLNVLKSLGRYSSRVKSGVIEICTKPLYEGHFTKDEALAYLKEAGFEVTRTEVEHFGLVENLYFKHKESA